jgi:hypothetical protein
LGAILQRDLARDLLLGADLGVTGRPVLNDEDVLADYASIRGLAEGDACAIVSLVHRESLQGELTRIRRAIIKAYDQPVAKHGDSVATLSQGEIVELVVCEGGV